MTIKIIPSNFNQTLYNSVALNPLQSWEWGEAREKMGIEILRIGEFDGNKLKNVFQITFHKIPYSFFTLGYLPRSAVPSKSALETLIDEGKKRNAIFIKLEPYEKKSNIKNQISNILKASPHPLFPIWTQQIDLTKTEDELLKNMHPKTRYNIKLAQKKGIFAKEMTNNEGFEIFSRLYFETCRRQGYRGHTKNYHKVIFETLKEKIAHIFVAFYPANGQNTPLSSFELFIFNDVLYYPYGGSSLEYRNFMAANLLMWEMIKFGKKSGAKIFDMWGSLGPDYRVSSSIGPSASLRTNPNRGWMGFTRFKEGYGGKFVEFVGSFDLILSPALYKLYTIVHSTRRKLLKIL